LADSGDEYWDAEFGVPGVDGPVYAILSAGKDLYFGGSFARIGGITEPNLARWNESGWTSVGGGIGGGPFPNVLALATFKGDVYAAGVFSQAGGMPATNIARWDGTNWFPLGSGVNNIVRVLSSDGTNLYAGGSFTAAGGISAMNIAKWDGTNWSPLGAGVLGTAVDSLAVGSGQVYAGGRFADAGGIGATNVAVWNGTNWSALGEGIRDFDGAGGGNSGIVRALLVNDDGLYVGGGFRLAGAVGATNIARWDGTNWWPVGGGIDVSGDVSTLQMCGVYLYVGGFFSSAGGGAAMSVARWDGRDWYSLGAGIGYAPGAGAVNAMVSRGSQLYVGGTFRQAGMAAATNIALWHIPHSLSISQAGNQVSLSWPSTGTNFVLEAKGNVTLTNWSEVSPPPVIVDNECVVTNTINGAQRVYRLRRR